MKHPFQSLSNNTSLVSLVALTGITLFLIWQIYKIDRHLRISESLGIVSLEFAGSSARARNIVDAWREAKVLDQAKLLQWIDFTFIAAYSMTLSLACIWATKFVSDFNANWLITGITLSWGQWVAALLDVSS